MSQRHRVSETIYQREFRAKDNSGCGFAFDCDEDGNISFGYDMARVNFLLVTQGWLREFYYDLGVTSFEHSYIMPTVVKCDCGEELHLWDALDNMCECGLCYNSSGQVVVPSWKCDKEGVPYDY